MPNLPQLASIATLTMIGTISMEPTLAIAQNRPRGCWEVMGEGKLTNKIFDCGENQICAEIAAGRVDGKPPTRVGEEVFIGPATQDRAKPQLWRGRIWVYYRNEKHNRPMVLEVKSSRTLEVRDGILRRIKRTWNKLENCP